MLSAMLLPEPDRPLTMTRRISKFPPRRAGCRRGVSPRTTSSAGCEPLRVGVFEVARAGEALFGEEIEAYDVDVLSGASVVRTLTGAAPGLLYAGADELADFGAPQSMLALRVYQKSLVAGRGFPLSATIAIA